MTRPRIKVAVDPGSGGGIAWQIEGGTAGSTGIPPSIPEIVAFFQRIEGKFVPGWAYIEQLVKFIPGGGNVSSTMAVYAQNHGAIYATMISVGFNVNVITPQCWIKALGLGITGRQKAVTEGMTTEQARQEKARVRHLNEQLKRDWKSKLRAKAQELFPAEKVTMKTADALLILQYGMLMEQNERANPKLL